VIGRHTFFDFGPPTALYELFLIHAGANGTSIERISLTPPGDACTQPANVEVASGSLDESVAELMGKTSPCAISEKELRRELKRCKKCMVFSGAHVAMQVQCEGATRIIRADVLDKDMFDSAPQTPEHTSWTMQLLNRIDHALGPGVMDRPVLPIPEPDQKNVSPQNSDALRDIDSGKYDELFHNAPDKPSDLYRAAQIRPPSPIVRLLSSTPFQPKGFVAPEYPPLARLARISGTVNIAMDVGPDGSATNFTVEKGHPMLRPATEKAVRGWKFSKDAAGQRIHAAIEFFANCPTGK
jgi:TonB family protein